jgi:hypothetical protein
VLLGVAVKRAGVATSSSLIERSKGLGASFFWAVGESRVSFSPVGEFYLLVPPPDRLPHLVLSKLADLAESIVFRYAEAGYPSPDLIPPEVSTLILSLVTGALERLAQTERNPIWGSGAPELLTSCHPIPVNVSFLREFLDAKLELEFTCRNHVGGVKITVGLSCHLAMQAVREVCEVKLELRYTPSQS